MVASNKEASLVLKELKRIKNSKDKEQRVLATCIAELEGDILHLKGQMMDAAKSSADLAVEAQRKLDKVRRERNKERNLLKT